MDPKVMEVIVKRCAGLDVHKEIIVACVRLMDDAGKVRKSVKSFKTMTGDLRRMSAWMEAQGVTAVAMESTGVFWKPVFNVLEGHFDLLLCNAGHIKNVPGRKTDVKDSEWIAQLLQCGLLKGSYVPHRAQRDLRDLTRHRAQLASEHTREANRIHKVLEDANVKISSVASEVLGKSGRAMLWALIEGRENPKQMAEHALGQLRGKIPQLREALDGHVTDHHRFLLRTHLEHAEYIERQIAAMTDRIETLIAAGAIDPAQPCAPDGALLEETAAPEFSDGPEASAAQAAPEPEVPQGPVPFAQAMDLIDEIPGIDRVSAAAILAEIGANMGQYPSPGHLASWAAICPGNNESAGKRKSGKTRKANRWLKRVLTQAAWAASHVKKSYFYAQFHRLARKRGKKRAIIAVAHSILLTAYHMLSRRQHYRELGADFFDRMNPERLKHYHVKRLESLGFNVTLEKADEAA
jgi:transposase